jgi:hypothetical protein
MAITLEHTSHLLQPQILPFSKNSSTLTQNDNDTGTQFSPLATPEIAMLKTSSNTKTAKIETLNYYYDLRPKKSYHKMPLRHTRRRSQQTIYTQPLKER